MANEVLLFAPLAISIVLSVALAVYVGLKSRLRVRGLFVLMSLDVAFLAATYALELLSPTLEGKLFWNDLEYIVNVTVPPLFFIFTITFLGREVVTGKWRLLFFVIPAISLFLVWTNDLHHLFYTQVGLEGNGMYASFDHIYGPGFILHSVYSLGLLLYSMGLLIIYYLRSSPMYRKQVRLVLVAALIPIFALLIGFQPFVPISLTYLFVIGFTAGGFLIFLGTFMYELFDVVPLAMEKILETVDDGIIVTTPSGKVIFANRTVLERNGSSSKGIYARPLSALSPELSEDRVREARGGGRVEVTLGLEGKRRVYSLKVTPIKNREGTTTSLLLTLRDITEEKEISESLKVANVKLNLLSSVTRHDILNQVTVVRGAGELLRESALDEQTTKKFGRLITEAAESIERQFSFAQDYQSLGVRAPEWQSAVQAFERATALGLASGIDIAAELDEVRLLADPLIDRVFSILLDNTQRHGERATQVRVWYEVRGGALAIVYEDNGVGVADLDKERIFERGFGRSGGLGLFLARQILDVNGGSIRETGAFGKGARFELVFPPGRWRLGPLTQ
jgi:PAS domain S-box-containing protein